MVLFCFPPPLPPLLPCSPAPLLPSPHGSGFSDSVIQDVIHSHLVLPNRITIPLVGDVELAKLRFPMPKVLASLPGSDAAPLQLRGRSQQVPNTQFKEFDCATCFFP